MSKKIVFFSLFFLLGDLILTGQVYGEDVKKHTIIVPQHFKTVKEAVENSKAGDIILVKEGTYIEKDGLRLKSDLILMGQGADKTIIKLGPLGIPIAAEQGGFNNITIKDISLELSGESVRLFGVNGFLLQNCALTSKGPLSCVEISASKNVKILNCTIADSNTGVSIGYGPVELIIRNSIFYKNEFGIQVFEMPVLTDTKYLPEGELERLRQGPRKDVSMVLAYNVFWNVRDLDRCKKGEFDISKNPNFADAKNGDFHLESGSPCIDTGDPDPKYNDPDGTRNDIGALPYVSKRK